VKLLRRFLFLTLLVFVHGAEQANASGQRLAQVQEPKQDEIPPGGCTPIGLTARGDIVFPWQCRALIEKQRGPVSEELPAAPPAVVPAQIDPAPKIDQAPQSTPAANVVAEPEEPKRGSREKRTSKRRQQKQDAASRANSDRTGAVK
jgi:hypothetical protein